MQSLLITVQHRPYVALFLTTFLVIGILNQGLVRTLLFLIIGYTVAFLSEFCSIRWGFPYGMYHYLYENMQGELMLGGVPVWDSVSYLFMGYASWEMACRFRIGGRRDWGPTIERLDRAQRGKPSDGGEKRQDPPILSAAFLMTVLDIITDPLAVRGDRWFLGKIFYYPNGGIYFGVPLSNFAGWFLVGLIIFTLYNIMERVGAQFIAPLQKPPPLRTPILGPLFYLSILLFNLAITFWIREWKLAGIGLLLACTTIFFFRFRLKK